MDECLKKYIDISEYVNDFTKDDLSVVVTDREKVLKYVTVKKERHFLNI